MGSEKGCVRSELYYHVFSARSDDELAALSLEAEFVRLFGEGVARVEKVEHEVAELGGAAE